MLGKTKVAAAEKTGVRLQAKNNKWYRYVSLVQMAVFAAMHLILGVYFAFVSSEYVNHPGFTTRIEAHRHMDQICAIICFVLFVVGLRLFYGLLKQKKISILYYVYLAASAILPILYLAMSNAYVMDAMVEILNESGEIYDGLIWTNSFVYEAGKEFGQWSNEVDDQIILDCLARIGEEAEVEISLADFNMSGLISDFRNSMYAWNRFELYAIVNAALSVVFAVCGFIFLPLKKSKLFKK